MVRDQYGVAYCAYNDSSIAECDPENCPLNKTGRYRRARVSLVVRR